jgi:hypothetical protein
MNYIGKYIKIAKNVVIKVLYQKNQNNCILVSKNGYEWYDIHNRKIY